MGGPADRPATAAGVLAALAAVAALVSAVVPAAPAPPASAAAPPSGAPVVLVGVPGLMWEEAGPGTTPELWSLAEDGAIGDMSIRTATSRTCPVDGWLTVSAGQRAFSERQRHSICELPVPPARDGDGAVVEDYADHVAVNAESPYGARVGLLGRAVHDAGGTTLAVGPGAALAAADGQGRVDDYIANPSALTEERVAGAWLTVVDLDGLSDLYLDPPVDPEASPGPEASPEGDSEPEPDPVQSADRLEALSAIDERIGTVADAVPEGATLIVAGVSVEAGRSNLNAALLHGPGPAGGGYEGRYLTSESTRRDGLVTLTDTTTTLLRSLGMDPPPATVGRSWAPVERPAELGAAVDGLAEFNTAANVVESLMAGFFSLLVAIQLLIYAAAAYAVHRWGGRDRDKRAAVLAATRAVALGGASVPVASYLANLVPWWSFPVPEAALPLCVLLFASLIVTAALAGPWRRDVLGPMTVVAGITTAVLFTDMCTGANLQMNSPMGYTPIVAGRFYGLGNIAFATFSTGMLMAVAGIAHYLIAAGRRRTAVAVASAVGGATVLVVGWPGLGTDFGGLFALVPGLAVTVLMIAGRRVTLVRMAAVCAGGAAVLAAVAYWDYLRPPAERSHFGLFAGQVLEGDAWPIVQRKLGAMLGTLGNWQLTLLAGCALLFLFAVLNKPTNWRMGVLQRTYEYAPMLRAGLTGSLVTALVGFAANDSGIAIPALALTVAVPLTLSAATWVLRREGPGAAGGRGAEDEGVSRRTPSGSPR
ncbi:hypothetical protein O4J56_17410 [Nocardiopsis sp. RSe5-2]|uniref:Uncharacterized protein n=1 Tax=Nocardiopsis endophytica TaxID=3018445 RepID=A0ABT4U650_9ACTN|nr:hypothetical protein [Nocardiopsis endophytica]MDA2812424.1 hypothetical protein [Nocardiopsis endophytica]